MKYQLVDGSLAVSRKARVLARRLWAGGFELYRRTDAMGWMILPLMTQDRTPSLDMATLSEVSEWARREGL